MHRSVRSQGLGEGAARKRRRLLLSLGVLLLLCGYGAGALGLGHDHAGDLDVGGEHHCVVCQVHSSTALPTEAVSEPPTLLVLGDAMPPALPRVASVPFRPETPLRGPPSI